MQANNITFILLFIFLFSLEGNAQSYNKNKSLHPKTASNKKPGKGKTLPSDLEGEWAVNCGNGLTTFSIGKEENIISLYGNSIYINVEVEKLTDREYILKFKNIATQENWVEESLKITESDISKDKIIGKFFIKKDGKVELHWIGLYNMKKQKLDYSGKKYYADEELINYLFVKSERTNIDSLSINLYKNRKTNNLVATLNKLISNDDMEQFEIIDVVDIKSNKESIQVENKLENGKRRLLLFNNGMKLKEWSFTSKSDTLDNDKYVNYYIDINKDNIPDKVVSSAPGMGDELSLYIKKDNKFNLVLKTINFSQDGGNKVSDIKETKEGFVIVTTFPDRGYYEENYQIIYGNNSFILKNVVYKTSSWQDDYTKTYVCNVIQNINISKNPYKFKIKGMPGEENRNQECSVEYYSGKTLQEFIDRFKERNSPQIVQGIERYKQLLQTFPITQQNILQYNDIGYYLQQSQNNREAIFLLTKLIEKFPNRVVAYLNIADAYWEINDKGKAKEYYQKYISLMKTQDKDLKKIPQRVYDRNK